MMWGYGPNMGMMGWGGYGFGLLHMIVWLVILAAIVAGVVWLVRMAAQPGVHQFSARRSPGLQVLEERYARGEINRDEYLQKKQDISG